MTTGQRMKDRRKAIGISAEKLAEMLGISPATIYRYENGDIEKVPGDRLGPIANALRTTPAYLMGWDTTAENEIQETPAYNVLRIAARDGSYREKRLSDEDLAAVLVLVDRLPDASEDL